MEEDAGALRHSPVSQTPPERMTMERMAVGCGGGSFIARRVHLGANGVGQERCSQNE